MVYLWLKAVHVAAVLIFIGGLFAQTFALAAARQGDGAASPLERWDRQVTVPAIIVLWLAGAALAAQGAWFGNGWLWAKLVFVLALTALHGIQSGRLRRLRRGEEVPARLSTAKAASFIAAALAVIASLVVVKPF